MAWGTLILAVSALSKLSWTSSTLLDFFLPLSLVEYWVVYYTLDILANMKIIIVEDKDCGTVTALRFLCNGRDSIWCTAVTQYLHSMLNHMGKETKSFFWHPDANAPNIFISKLGNQHNTRGLITTGLFHQFPHTHYLYTHTSPRVISGSQKGQCISFRLWSAPGVALKCTAENALATTHSSVPCKCQCEVH